MLRQKDGKELQRQEDRIVFFLFAVSVRFRGYRCCFPGVAAACQVPAGEGRGSCNYFRKVRAGTYPVEKYYRHSDSSADKVQDFVRAALAEGSDNFPGFEIVNY